MATAGAAIASAEMVEDAITAAAVSRLLVDMAEADRKHAAVPIIVVGHAPMRVTRHLKGAAAARPVVAANLTAVVARPVVAANLTAATAVADTGKH